MGDIFAYYYLSDRIVHILYDIVNYGENGGKFRLSVNLTTAAYCLGWEYDNGEKSQYKNTLISAKDDFDIKASDLSESHIEEALNRLIAWDQEQVIEQKLREEAADHSLVAKALLGDIEALKSSEDISQLYVPEFSDYSTMTRYDRLLLFAQAYKNGELDDILARKKFNQRLMNLTAASRILKTQGWFSMEPGKMWLSLPDRFIKLVFGFVHLHDQYSVHLELKYLTKRFLWFAGIFIFMDNVIL